MDEENQRDLSLHDALELLEVPPLRRQALGCVGLLVLDDPARYPRLAEDLNLDDGSGQFAEPRRRAGDAQTQTPSR